MHQRTFSATLFGIDGVLVEVEADIAGGLPRFVTVGLAEAAVKEAKVRVQSAIENSGLFFPNGRISINLAPAQLRKSGSALDLAVAIAILAAENIVPSAQLDKILFWGELALSGGLRPVAGVLAAADLAVKQGIKVIIVPPGNGKEAALLSKLEVRTVETLNDVVAFLREGGEKHAPIVQPSTQAIFDSEVLDLSDVKGQWMARRALEVSAAGGHNLLFVGGPGSGKTMLAERLPGIMPEMQEEEALAVTKIYSVAGLNIGGGLIRNRPFRSPHHSTTPSGLVGGGVGIPRAGEITLAHCGVLFLDELLEFNRRTLEVLRQPLEAGEVLLSRAMASIRYPASILLVAAMNPCPCGFTGHPKKRCVCSRLAVERYKAKLSGPLLDRIDIHVNIPSVDYKELLNQEVGESSVIVRKRVALARKKQWQRNGNCWNAHLQVSQLAKIAFLDQQSKSMLLKAVQKFSLSARAYNRILRVSRTIADLDSSQDICIPHLAEAIQYREDVFA